MKRRIPRISNEELDQMIIQMYSKMSRKEIAKELGVTFYRVKYRVELLMNAGLLKRKKRPWTLSEIEFLKSNHRKMRMKEIATVLNRNYDDVRAYHWQVTHPKKEATP